jgi:SAM-dependent methyltransferase
MSKRALSEMSQSEIEDAVRRKYTQVAEAPDQSFSFPVGRQFALDVGYPEEGIDQLPESLFDSFTGANNPQPFVDLKEGETVLDLGCGAGLDMYLYARAIGPSGRVYGVDISKEMVDKARGNMAKVGMTNTEIRVGRSTDIPLGEGAVDVVATNGIYNLTPDKEAAMKEVFRVLKPGGRTVLSEIVLKEALPEEIRKNADDWFRCIGGALPEAEFISLMEMTGFEKVEVVSRVRNARCGHELAICANIRAYKPTGDSGSG